VMKESFSSVPYDPGIGVSYKTTGNCNEHEQIFAKGTWPLYDAMLYKYVG